MVQENKQPISNSVLVLGGGIAGIKAGFDLAEAGRKVYLVEKKPSLGGFLPMLDRQFPTNDCNICYLVPETDLAGQTVSVEALPLTKMAELKGQAGDFTARLQTSPRYIDLSRCNACGDCLEGLRRRGYCLYTRSGHQIPHLPALPPSHSPRPFPSTWTSAPNAGSASRPAPPRP